MVVDGKVNHDQAAKFQHSTTFAQNNVIHKLDNLPLRSGIDICKGELAKKMVDCSLHTWKPEDITKYTAKIFSLLTTKADILNTDDTDMIQHTLSNLRLAIEADNSLVALVIPDANVAKNIMEILLSILTKYKKMVNLIQYMVDMLSVYFDGTTRTVTAEESELFRSILEIGFTQNKDNSDIMKELIRVAAKFCSE